MINSKENITDSTSNNDVTKKATLPVLVGTSVIMFAGVISCDVNVASQLNTILNDNTIVTSQDSQMQLEDQSEDDSNKKSKSKLRYHVKNSSGQLFYDSDMEDDDYYYGNWKNIDDDGEDDFIFWS
jgi:hypothetical protein